MWTSTHDRLQLDGFVPSLDALRHYFRGADRAGDRGAVRIGVALLVLAFLPGAGGPGPSRGRPAGRRTVRGLRAVGRTGRSRLHLVPVRRWLKNHQLVRFFYKVQPLGDGRGRLTARVVRGRVLDVQSLRKRTNRERPAGGRPAPQCTSVIGTPRRARSRAAPRPISLTPMMTAGGAHEPRLNIRRRSKPVARSLNGGPPRRIQLFLRERPAPRS